MSDMEKFAAAAARASSPPTSPTSPTRKSAGSWGTEEHSLDPSLNRKNEVVFKTGMVPGTSTEDNVDDDWGGARQGKIDIEALDDQIDSQRGVWGLLKRDSNSKKKTGLPPPPAFGAPFPPAASPSSSPPPRSGELPSKPDFAQRNSKPDPTSELTFKPPTVPNAMDSDSEEEYVLEIKCLDDGITTHVDHRSQGLAGISDKERMRIRDGVVLGEKLLFEKIAQFKGTLNEKKEDFARYREEESRRRGEGRKSTGGLFKGFGKSRSAVNTGSSGGPSLGGTPQSPPPARGPVQVPLDSPTHAPIDRRASTGTAAGTVDRSKHNRSEFTFALKSTPHSALDGDDN